MLKKLWKVQHTFKQLIGYEKVVLVHNLCDFDSSAESTAVTQYK